MEREKFNIEQIIQAIKFLGSSYYSSDTIYTYKQSPIHILVHEEILRFSKEEIDAAKDIKSKDGYSVWGVTFAIRNPYIFSAFLKIGAFQDKFHPDSKWLLEQFKKPNDDLYSLVFDVQNAYNSRNIHIVQDEPYGRNFLFKCIFDSSYTNFNLLDTPEKIYIVDSYITDFGKEKEEELLYFLYKNYSDDDKKIKICNHTMKKMKEIGIDFSKNELLNNLLPEENYLNRDSKKFFISSSNIPRMKNLINCGFKFNEKDYSFYGDNLFIGTLKSGRKDVIETIIPELQDITPKTGTLEEQNKFVMEFVKGMRNNDLAQLVQRQYDRLVLSYELSNDRTEKKKLKI
jgi:hypothetical protein